MERLGVRSSFQLRRLIGVLLLPILWADEANLKAQPSAPQKQVLEISSYWSANGVKAGGQIVLAVVLDIKHPYHINAHAPKPPFVPTSIQLLSGPDSVVSSTPI